LGGEDSGKIRALGRGSLAVAIKKSPGWGSGFSKLKGQGWTIDAKMRERIGSLVRGHGGSSFDFKS